MEIEENIRSRELTGFAGGSQSYRSRAAHQWDLFPFQPAPADRLAGFQRAISWVVSRPPLCATFLLIPAGKWDKSQRVHWYDWLGALAGLVVGLYIFVQYPQLVNSLGEIYLNA